MDGKSTKKKGFLRYRDFTQVKSKIQFCMIVILIAAMLLLGVVSVVLNYTSTVGTLDQTMTQTAVYIGERVGQELDKYKLLAYETGTVAKLSDASVSTQEKLEIVNNKVKKYNMVECALINEQGINIFNDIDCSQREYFTEAMAGKTYISAPSISKATGKMSMMISAPLWEDGVPDSRIVGVIMFIPQENFLNNIMESISISKNSGAYMIDKNGITIADTTMETVENQQNIQEEAKTDSSLNALAAIHVRMRNGETGFGSYHINGNSKFIAFAPVEGTDGWSIGVTAKTTDFISSTVAGVIITIVILIFAIIAGSLVAIKVGKSIGDPIKLCADRLILFSEGDLHSEVPHFESSDEIGTLARTTQVLTSGLSILIRDIDYMLSQIAAGDFTVDSQEKEHYKGDFHNILVSMGLLLEKMSTAMSNINEASSQVALGSIQLAENAQSLAEGATEQAGTVEELTATVENISSMAQTSAEKAADSQQQAENFAKEAEVGNEEMHKLTQAMKNINDTSKEIESIIVQIEDIASQTNLLSLNASIEAARAGEAGRGFAVVADQIGKLAADSAQSAVNTRELIQKSIEEIAHGNRITETTSESLQQVIEGIKHLAVLAQESNTMSSAQAEAIKQVEQGIEQISGVVQSNSASAEETSATSEELSAQSENLKAMVSEFKLR